MADNRLPIEQRAYYAFCSDDDITVITKADDALEDLRELQASRTDLKRRLARAEDKVRRQLAKHADLQKRRKLVVAKCTKRMVKVHAIGPNPGAVPLQDVAKPMVNGVAVSGPGQDLVAEAHDVLQQFLEEHEHPGW